MIKTIGEFKKLIDEIPDNYRIKVSNDNGVDGKSADYGMTSNSPIRIWVDDTEKYVSLDGSEYTDPKEYKKDMWGRIDMRI